MGDEFQSPGTVLPEIGDGMLSSGKIRPSVGDELPYPQMGKLFGVNYGNVFIPEGWMMKGPVWVGLPELPSRSKIARTRWNGSR